MTKLTKQTKPVKNSQIIRNWYEIDVKNKILGRVAGKVAQILQGKHKVDYVPYLDCGDYVIVTNAQAIKLTGRKPENKVYTRYSGYPGGLKKIPFNKLINTNPKQVIINAVSKMLPKNKLREKYLKRLLVYTNEDHPYKNKTIKI